MTQQEAPIPVIQTGTTFEDVFDGLAHEALQILYDRQRKYGPENIRRQGLWGIFTRIKDDKIARVQTSFNGLIRKGIIELEKITDTASDESFEDALFDIANYALIMIAVNRGTWGKPMREDTGEVEALAKAHPDGIPQLQMTPEEEAAERARAILADEPDPEETYAPLEKPSDWRTGAVIAQDVRDEMERRLRAAQERLGYSEPYQEGRS